MKKSCQNKMRKKIWNNKTWEGISGTINNKKAYPEGHANLLLWRHSQCFDDLKYKEKYHVNMAFTERYKHSAIPIPKNKFRKAFEGVMEKKMFEEIKEMIGGKKAVYWGLYDETEFWIYESKYQKWQT